MVKLEELRIWICVWLFGDAPSQPKTMIKPIKGLATKIKMT